MALKRKIESKMSETVKKSSKVEGSEVKKKPLTKAELMVKFKALEEGYEKLAKENVKHLETITRLERKFELKDSLSKPEKTSTSVQTEDMNRMFCVEC